MASGWPPAQRRTRSTRRCRSTRCISARGDATAGACCPTASSRRALADYVIEMGFTHVELMPITEHPFYGSWGYQTTGYFAPTARYGTPQDFMSLVDHLHQRGIGVMLDWVPSHFPDRRARPGAVRRHAPLRACRPAPGLPPGVELGDLQLRPRRGAQLPHVVGHVLARQVPHRRAARRCRRLDALPRLRAQAAANGSRTRTAAARTSTRSSSCAASTRPSIATIPTRRRSPRSRRPGRWSRARPTMGGLGFGMKWNMGWMHDTLRYMDQDPIHRQYHHGELTFSLVYAFNENFVLPLSHDEVVHGKGSLLARCRATSGSSSPTCARSSATCGRTPARSCSSWAASSASGASGRTRRARMVGGSRCRAMPACSAGSPT